MRLLSRILIVLLACSALPTQAAAEKKTVRWYDVEVIVFRHVDPRTDETWPLDRGLPDIGNAQPLFPASDAMDAVETSALDAMPSNIPASAPTPFTPLPEDQFKLDNSYAALDRSSRYDPIVHFAWTQPALEREQSPMLRVTLPGALDAKAEVEEEPAQSEFGDEFAMSSGDSEELEKDAASAYVRPLDGRIQVGVGLYLHVDLDLLYLPDDINPDVIEGSLPADDEFMEEKASEREARMEAVMQALASGDISSEEAEILMLEPEDKVFHGFRLKEVRRVRSGELHYFDHPAFGVLVAINPREITLEESGMR